MNGYLSAAEGRLWIEAVGKPRSNLPVPGEGGDVRNRRYPAVSASMNDGPDPYPAADIGGALRTAANQSLSAVSDQPGQVEQRDQEVVERPC
jgi:hypothetical protein